MDKGVVAFGAVALAVVVLMLLTSTDKETIEKNAVSYYARAYGDADVRAEAVSFGCHAEVRIYKNGTRVKTLTYAAGNFFG
ncbi:MAG: hypothetical protein AB1468_03875 [Candidatus Micrarchaeota archaeon]